MRCVHGRNAEEVVRLVGGFDVVVAVIVESLGMEGSIESCEDEGDMPSSHSYRLRGLQ